MAISRTKVFKTLESQIPKGKDATVTLCVRRTEKGTVLIDEVHIENCEFEW